MERQFGVEQSSEVSVVEPPGGGDHVAETAPARSQAPLPEFIEPLQERVAQERVELSSERGELLEKVHRLEAELERYRAHAERTSKLFLSATNYAEWVRERARRDAELALRKARAKAEKLGSTARELEWTEGELVRAQDELARLQALTDETRTRLSAFLTAGLQVLNTEREAGQEDGPKPPLGDLPDTLQRQLAATPVSAPAWLAELDKLEP